MHVFLAWPRSPTPLLTGTIGGIAGSGRRTQAGDGCDHPISSRALTLALLGPAPQDLPHWHDPGAEA